MTILKILDARIVNRYHAIAKRKIFDKIPVYQELANFGINVQEIFIYMGFLIVIFIFQILNRALVMLV